MRPIWGLEVFRRDVDDATPPGFDNHCLQRAVKRRGLGGSVASGHQVNVRKDRFLNNIFIMRADADSEIERSLERNPQPSACHVQILAVTSKRHVDVIATFCDSQPPGRGNIRLDLTGVRAPFVAELK